VAEVSLHTLTWVVGEGNEGFALVQAHALDVTANNIVAAGESVFVMQSPGDLRRRMSLLEGGLLIITKNLIDVRIKVFYGTADNTVRTQIWTAIAI